MGHAVIYIGPMGQKELETTPHAHTSQPVHSSSIPAEVQIYFRTVPDLGFGIVCLALHEPWNPLQAGVVGNEGYDSVTRTEGGVLRAKL